MCAGLRFQGWLASTHLSRPAAHRKRSMTLARDPGKVVRQAVLELCGAMVHSHHPVMVVVTDCVEKVGKSAEAEFCLTSHE